MTKAKAKLNPDQMPLFKPPSDWSPPTELPDLRGRLIALDIETKDDGGSLLLEAGAMIAIIFALAAAIVLVLWARHKFRK